jgi:hypothetical protein
MSKKVFQINIVFFSDRWPWIAVIGYMPSPNGAPTATGSPL